MKKAGVAFLVLCISLTTLAQESGDLDSKFYFRFIYSQPTKSYIGVDEDEFWDYFDRVGGAFELGHIFILNQPALADGLRLGINVDYAEFSLNHLGGTDVDDINLGVVKLASKVGPSLSYSPHGELVFDVFFKAKIPWVGGIVLYTVDDVDEVFIAKPGIGFATGVNLRYRFLMFGFEFNSDKMKFESEDFPGEYFGNYAGDSDKTPMPSMSFSLGFCF